MLLAFAHIVVYQSSISLTEYSEIFNLPLYHYWLSVPSYRHTKAIVMKRLLLIATPLLLLLTACNKQPIVRPPVDESEWLRKERGIVVASDFGCTSFVIETNRGYALLRMWGGSAPFMGTTLYGNFSSWGVKTVYNRTEGYLMTVDVQDYWLSYWQAMDGMAWNCGGMFPGKANNGSTLGVDSTSTSSK